MNDTMMTDEHRELRGTAGLLLDSIICFKFHSTDAHHHNHIWGSIVKFSQTQYLLFSTHVEMEMWNNAGQSCCLFIAWRFKLIIIHLILSGLFLWCVSLIHFWPGYLWWDAVQPIMRSVSPGCDMFRAAQVLNLSPADIRAGCHIPMMPVLGPHTIPCWHVLMENYHCIL